MAEDNVMNQQILNGILNARDCKVTIVNNGQLAYEAIATSDFDLVFMDVQMPVLNGLLATSKIKDSLHFSKPIIALASIDEQVKFEKELSMNFNSVLAKPFSKEKVIAMVDQFCKAPRPKPELPMVNLQRLEEMCSNDRDIIRHLATTFQITTPQLIAEFEKGLSEKDGNAMYNANHQLKAAFAMFQARIPLQLALKLELLLKVTPLNESMIRELSADMINSLEAVYLAIDELAND